LRNRAGARVIALSTLGLRSMYSKREIKNIADMKGLKVRVQATPTEDTMFPAYGPRSCICRSQRLHVVADRRGRCRGKRRQRLSANKHYEVAPVLSMTEHEANNSLVWVSDKLWNSLTPETAGLGCRPPATRSQDRACEAIELEHQCRTSCGRSAVKIVTDVDKSGFVAIAESLSRQARQGAWAARREGQT